MFVRRFFQGVPWKLVSAHWHMASYCFVFCIWEDLVPNFYYVLFEKVAVFVSELTIEPREHRCFPKHPSFDTSNKCAKKWHWSVWWMTLFCCFVDECAIRKMKTNKQDIKATTAIKPKQNKENQHGKSELQASCVNNPKEVY